MMSLDKSPFAGGTLGARILGTMLIAALVIVPGAVLSQPRWVLNGRPVCTADNDQITTAIISDGSGGAIITWQDYRNGNYDIFAQRVNSGGAPQWTANGVSICTLDSSQQGLHG